MDFFEQIQVVKTYVTFSQPSLGLPDGNHVHIRVTDRKLGDLNHGSRVVESSMFVTVDARCQICATAGHCETRYVFGAAYGGSARA